MKKFFLLLFVFMTTALGAESFYPEYFNANFRVPETVDWSVRTPAPRGYRPVYISHYGRHGARFMSDPENYTRLINPLREADSLDNLTPAGKAFYEQVVKFYEDYAKDREGELTPIGWEQHRRIANAIYDTYRRVFRRSGEVTAWCTYYQRCIVSMSSFTLALAKRCPRLKFFTESSGRRYREMLNETGLCELKEPGWDYSQEAFLEATDPSQVLTKMFKDPSLVRNPKAIPYSVQRFIIDIPCVDPTLSMGEDIITPEEMEVFYRMSCLRFYERCTVGGGRFGEVVKGIVEQADEDLALKKSPVRLRFGHDIVIGGMLSLLNADGFGETPASAWDSADVMDVSRIPMACTMLFVFYRKGSSTLVKVLLDGDELHFPIESVKGPYYDWKVFKEYVGSCCK